jgi:hypothetical protein
MLLRSAIPKLIVFIYILSVSLNLNAQVKQPYTVSFKDSLQTDETSPFLYNTIKISNTNNSPISVIISAIAPRGWRILSSNENILSAEIAAGETQFFPITIMKQKDALSQWLPVMLKAQLKNTSDTSVYAFYIKANAINRFKVFPLTTYVQLSGKQNNFSGVFVLRNTGSVEDKYKIKVRNKHLSIDRSSSVILLPGRDTTIQNSFSITGRQFTKLQTEKILIEVTNSKDHVSGYSIDLVKLRNSIKEHPSAYSTFPLELEAGFFQLNGQASYYAAFKGEAKLRKYKLSYFYHSKQFGYSNKLEKNIYGMTISNDRWKLDMGQMVETKYYYSNGNGIKLTYNKNGFETSISGIKHNSYYSLTNNTLMASIRYPVHKMMFAHYVAMNFDRVRKNAYVISNELQLLSKKNISLSANAGIGLDYSIIRYQPTHRNKYGTAFGYAFLLNAGKWVFTSNVQYNNYFFPGITGGLQMQSHNVRLQMKNKYLGIFYQYNQNLFNILRDTLYNTDVLNFNMSRYGATVGINSEKQFFSFSTGKLRQNIQYGNSLPKYQFYEMYYMWGMGKHTTLTINSTSGYTKSYGSEGKSILVTSSNFVFNARHAGIKGYYLQNPFFNYNSPSKEFLHYEKILLISPFVNFTIFKRLGVGLNYTVSRSLYDNHVNKYAGFNLRYNNSNNGLSFHLTASLPLQSTQTTSLFNNRLNNQFIILSVHKKFNVPIITSKKFYTLTVIPFRDDNNNGKKDSSEIAIKNVQFNINKAGFISSNKGKIEYRNIDSGKYSITFDQIHELKGLLPVGGLTQSVNISKDAILEIPFKKSKVITGTVKIELDSYSHTVFTPTNIKVTATDSSGKFLYSTITDENGNFFINVLSTVYTVSLNPESFDEKIKPVRLSYQVDLSQKDEENVIFIVREKKRQIRYLKMNN